MPARLTLFSSSAKPSGSIRCNLHPLFAHNLMMLPVLGGICGWTRTILNIGANLSVRLISEVVVITSANHLFVCSGRGYLVGVVDDFFTPQSGLLFRV